MRIELDIDNVYNDGTIRTHVATDVEPLDADEDWEDWAVENLLPHTGTGRTYGDAGYFVEVTACDNPALVGAKFEFGI